MNQIVKWKDGQIVVRPGLVEDEITASQISRTVANSYPPDMVGLFGQFGSLCSQTESSSGLSFSPEYVRNMDAAQQRAAYEAFLKMPKSLRGKWADAYDAVDSSADIDLGPEPLPETATKKA